MCGIVGYIGNQQSSGILIDGLKRLEYRGYDSAGIAVHDGENINVVKSKGKLVNLVEKINKAPVRGTLGIGHTRWATHGAPSDINSHPHISGDGTIAVVHNGIIENYIDIKNELIEKGYTFVSETDTETVAHLIDYYYKTGVGFVDAVYETLKRIEGSYALGVICKDFPDTLVAARKNCPLVIGIGKNENFIASDIPAILHHTRKVYFLDDMEFAVIKSDSIKIFNMDKNEVKKDIFNVEWDIDAAEKGGYEHFMIKEINEQPRIINELVSMRMPKDKNFIDMSGIKLKKEDINELNRIYIVACGTAYHAGLIGKTLIEKFTKIPVIADVASEFRYREPVIDEKTLLIVVSQSGETADTLEVLRIAKRNNARVLAIVNAVGSSIAREADDVFYILAGPEISVASTKAFTAQVVAMELIAFNMAIECGALSKEEFETIKSEFYCLDTKIGQILDESEKIKALAEKYSKSRNVFFIGRGLDYVVSKEGSLKLKEIAYLHSEAYAAGELKHGPIAMIDDETLVIAILTQEKLFDKTLSNIKEVKARGASVIAIAMEGNNIAAGEADDIIYIPRAMWSIAPVLAAVPAQLFAYYMAYCLGTDIDQPRNLAKSVTVE